MKNYEILIGIDTGCNTGFSIYSPKAKKLIECQTLKIHQAMSKVKALHEFYDGAILVRVEDARKRKWIPPGKNEKAERGRREGAGSVKRDAIIWEDFLTDNKIPFEMVAPKDNITRIKAALFQKMTGWTEQTNEHARASAMLVVGR